ncbi:MAG: hypothetical protein JNK48_19905 [Bryobacterales bacterium]|nr:hypothetical protein [Bryobacterales bacterium]
MKKSVLNVYPALDDLNEAGRLSVELRHAMQDCLYLAMAGRLGTRFITGDRVFAERALTIYPSVESLGGQSSHKA